MKYGRLANRLACSLAPIAGPESRTVTLDHPLRGVSAGSTVWLMPTGTTPAEWLAPVFGVAAAVLGLHRFFGAGPGFGVGPSRDSAKKKQTLFGGSPDFEAEKPGSLASWSSLDFGSKEIQ